MAEICRVYAELEVCFPWERGDVLVLDNILVAHARNPFRGPTRTSPGRWTPRCGPSGCDRPASRTPPPCAHACSGSLIRLADQRYALLTTTSSLSADSRTMRRLVTELALAYDGRHSSSDNTSPDRRALLMVSYNSIDNAPPHPVRPEFLVGRNTDQPKPRWDTRFPLEAG
ncbi:hypothetical protein SMALA_1149 [Streptomyces malaysiensis subsp. malaysiensis]|nr:hypothetical protein SMALA_1149 [Streptomyces malaysiensis]